MSLPLFSPSHTIQENAAEMLIKQDDRNYTPTVYAAVCGNDLLFDFLVDAQKRFIIRAAMENDFKKVC